MPQLWKKIFSLGSTPLLLLLSAGCGVSSPSTANIAPVENFQLSRYMGRWYEIARLPHSFEQNTTDAQANYTLLSNGTVQVQNSGLRNGVTASVTGIARPVGNEHTGAMEVSFFRPFYGLYKIIYLDKNYTLAIVTSDTMNYVWILARKPVITQAELAMCLQKLQQWGFAVNLLQYPSGMIKSLLLTPHTTTTESR